MALSKLALALAVAPSAALVAPSAKVSSTKLSAEGKLDEIPEDTNRFTSRLATQEGFCLDLPGALAPMGQWDPAGFTSEASDNDIRRYREAETQHGRVAMLAVIGFLVAESWHPLFADVTSAPISKNAGYSWRTCVRWSMAGPGTSAMSGCHDSATRKPMTASMATRPCWVSASR